MTLEAIILAGGLGTRLKSVTGDLPKVMAPVGGRPFLEHIVSGLANRGVTRLILSIGYRGEDIRAHFGTSFAGLPIVYSEENEPLGTGGGVALALGQARSNDVFVLNGDTWVDLDYVAMLGAHQANACSLTIAVAPVPDLGRFGSVDIRDGRIVAFKEKGATGPGLINAGVYIFDKSSFAAARPTADRFSLETDLIERNLSTLNPLAFTAGHGFIDIGVPDDYARANRMFADKSFKGPLGS